MKYRPDKTKYQHSTIRDLRSLLETIEQWPEVQSIIPGRIRPTKTTVAIQIHVQYDTSTGIKCLCKSGGAVQEVFIVTTDRVTLKKKLDAL